MGVCWDVEEEESTRNLPSRTTAHVSERSQSSRATTQHVGACCRSRITSAPGLGEVRLKSEIKNLLMWKKLKP